MKNIRYYITLLFVTGFWFLADWWTKQWAEKSTHLPWGNRDGFFYLSQTTHNSGVAFGLPVPQWLQIVFTMAILAFLLYTGHTWLQKNRKQFLQGLIFGIVLGGALGNFWERVNQGYVVDFIVLGPIPNFNLADVGVTVGLILLIWMGWHVEKRMKDQG